VEGLTEDEIGRLLGCSGRTIGRRLEELGVSRRATGPVSKTLVYPNLYTAWSADLAYVVGLIVTYGNLDKDRVQVEFVSTDMELIELYCDVLNLNNLHIGVTKRLFHKPCYRVRLSDSRFRKFLESVGLTAKKSRTLSSLAIPDKYFTHFLRGVLDGNGSWYILNSGAGRYQYLRLELCSASKHFIQWIAQETDAHLGTRGLLYYKQSKRAYVLQYTHPGAIALGKWIYQEASMPGLARKHAIWRRMYQRESERMHEKEIPFSESNRWRQR